jgi:flagellar hook assembly protein FlgD
MEAGEHSLSWDGRNDAGSIVPAGTYLLRLDTGNQTQIKKLMMVK